MADTPTSGSTPPKRSMIIFGSIIGALLVLFGLGFLFEKSQTPQAAAISGSLNFNGLKPKEEPDKRISIKLMQRAEGQPGFTDTGVSIPVEDQASWTWDQAVAGTTYELKADAFFGSQPFVSSNSITSTAPSSGQTLTFNVTTADLPADLVPAPSPTPVPQVTVSGSIVINGFIPANSTVTIFGRKAGSNGDYVPAVEKLPAITGTTWSYDQAESGVSYEYQAEMYTADNTFIGQSNYITVTAPAANEIVTINSTASAPVQQAAISGTVQLQGPVEQNSTIIILQRKTGTSDYTVVGRYPAVNNTKWTWKGAAAGTKYDVTAALQVNEQNIASGNVVTVSAPADNVSITIDSGVSIPAPTQTVSVSCGSPDGTNHYNASIGIPQQPNAQMYYLEVGTSAGNNNTFANTVKPNQSQLVYVAGNSPYFARFVYSLCTDCNLQDHGNWSGWSPTYGFTCQ